MINLGKISAPVSISDVQQALGTSANDLATLCTHANINKWAKYKPVIQPLLMIQQTEPARETAFKTQKLGTETLIYGMRGQLNTGADNIATRLHGAYEYVGKPQGGSNSPYRLTDFDGYNANAQPSKFCQGLSTSYDKKSDVSLYITFGTNTSINAIDPFGDIGDYYLAVLIGNWLRVVSTTQLKSLTTATMNKATLFEKLGTLSADGVIKQVTLVAVSKYNDSTLNLTNWVDVSKSTLTTGNVAMLALPCKVGNAYECGVSVKFLDTTPSTELSLSWNNMLGLTINVTSGQTGDIINISGTPQPISITYSVGTITTLSVGDLGLTYGITYNLTVSIKRGSNILDTKYITVTPGRGLS